MGIEIERKYLVKHLPSALSDHPCREITQGYLCRQPAVRVRRERDDSGAERFTLTYKGLREAGKLGQTEYNLPLTEQACAHLMDKADGVLIRKKRYLVPINEGALLGRETTAG